MVNKEITKQQLMLRIKALNEQVKEMKTGEGPQNDAEENIMISGDAIHLFFNTAPIGISITNTKGEVIYANNMIADLLGYTLSEYKSINIGDTYADQKERKQLLALLDQGKRVRDFEAKLKHHNGSVFPVLMNSDYIELDGQKVLLTSIHDLSGFKQLQNELRLSEERSRILFNNAPVGLAVTDLEGRLTASNQAVQEMLGYTQEELEGRNVTEFYRNQADRKRLLEQIGKTHLVRDFETRLIRKNGGTIAVLLNIDIVEFADQNKVLLSSIRDISKYKLAEEELTRQRDFTDAILDVASSLILVLDKDGLITRFNRACEQTTGYTFQEVEGKHTWDFLSVNPEISKNYETMLIANYPSTHENTWRCKNGEELLISWSNTILPDQEGNIQYVIATGIDITDQRKAENRLQEANRRLTEGIKELEDRTLEMSRLSEMGDQLQSCQSMEEACAISAQYIQMICSETNGALYLIRPSKDLAEAVEMWGEDTFTQELFMPLDCWAMRRGRIHQVDGIHPGLLCKHINGPTDGQYLCIPMMAHGEVLGILHLNSKKNGKDNRSAEESALGPHKKQTVIAVAEHIALALSNLRLRETLRQQSIRDTLTGIYNRRYMEDSLSRELSRADREHKPVGVIMFDIDHFKDFNDIYGHDGGDALLHELGDYLRQTTRGEDIVCRYGGEEFVIVFPNASLEDTTLRAEEIRQGVKQLQIYHMGTPMGRCTLSLGVAAFPRHGASAEEVVKKADMALYRAKNEGRDRVVVYGEGI